jgi:alpha-N-arabinofuranosidase
MANLAQMVNVIAPIMTNTDGLFLQPIYFPIVEYGKQRGHTALDVWVSSPTYRIQNRGPEIAYLDVSATRNETTGEVFVNVLNRSRDRDVTASIETGGSLQSRVGVWQMNHPDLKATHTFGDDQRVRPATREETVTVTAGSFPFRFPAHSLTILRIR